MTGISSKRQATKEIRPRGLLGRKLGMTQIFDEDGMRIPVTVLEGGPCAVLSVKTREKDGYDGVQLGFEEAKEKSLTKPILGFFKKTGVSPKRFIGEIRLPKAGDFQIGQSLDVDIFTKGDYVSISAVTIGNGFQGGMKRWHWKGGRETRGSMHHRAPGSIGSTTTPGRVWKGHHLPGHMGNRRRTVENLEVVDIDKDQHLLLVKGAVPGKQGYVVIAASRKKAHKVIRKIVQPAAEAQGKKKKEEKPKVQPKKEAEKK